MNSRSGDDITITIRIGNTLNNDLIKVGRSYNFTMKRGTRISELFNEFTKGFPEEIQSEVDKYSIWTKKMIRLHDTNVIEDAFSDYDDSDLDIYDKGENMFYAVIDMCKKQQIIINHDLLVVSLKSCDGI